MNLTPEEIHRLIEASCRRAVIRYKFDFDDAYQIGCVACLEAVAKFDPNRGSLESWIRFSVAKGLILASRRETRRQLAPMSDYTEAPRDHRFRLLDFLDEISEDARTITQIILETPHSVLTAAGVPLGSRNCTRNFLRRLMAEQNGWNPDRFNSALKQIELALL